MLYVITTLSATVDLLWQLKIQARNLSDLNFKKHVAVIVRAKDEAPFIPDEKDFPHTKFVQVECDSQFLREYPPIAKIVAVKRAVEIFTQNHILIVDPDVVFTYNPSIRLDALLNKGKQSFASNCTNYMAPSSLKSEHANLVYGNRCVKGDKIGGAQYLLSPGDFSAREMTELVHHTMFIYRKTGLWIAEMLAWVSMFGTARLKVHPLLDFKLAETEFSFARLAAGKEVLMVHLAGDMSGPHTFDKRVYKTRSPFDDVDALVRKCVNPRIASYFYLTLFLGAAQNAQNCFARDYT